METDVRLAKIEIHLENIQKDLEQHMRRTEICEERLKYIEDWMIVHKERHESKREMWKDIALIITSLASIGALLAKVAGIM